MKYRVNEIFLSLQGEGYWTGTPMVFLRLSGCNLRCDFCDTDHSRFAEMSIAETVAAVKFADTGSLRVCITGGEPLLQLESRLINALHKEGFRIHVETNGTLPVPEGVDWVTCSPKVDHPRLEKADEIKLVFQGTPGEEEKIERWKAGFAPEDHLFLQPCDTGDPEENARILKMLLEYIERHPWWRLSLQNHKLIGIH